MSKPRVLSFGKKNNATIKDEVNQYQNYRPATSNSNSPSAPAPGSSSPITTPYGSPAIMDVSTFASNTSLPHPPSKNGLDGSPIPRSPSLSLPKSPSPSASQVDLPKDTPPEMIPILTLLTCHQNREYYEGYFMILNDLSSDGKTASDRKWVEVFGKLTGTVLSIWDADSLDVEDKEPSPTYINVTDSTFKSVSLIHCMALHGACLTQILNLPSPNGDLKNVIVLSTTLKNRFLLQFASTKLLNEWTAALRLSVFEYTCLQEAYTGALLSAKGSKLNGIRTLLSETKFRHEDWVSVRFGPGMPWKKCWTVVTPPDLKVKKKEAPAGSIAFYEEKKRGKKGPLAVVTGAYASYAVYPQSSLLVNNSTLIKVEGKVMFSDHDGEKDAAVFLMPEQHPGVLGFETLIRFLIPVLDVFKLYGRPKRLNADKSDMRSLLFAMPTLPRTQYLDLADTVMLVGVNGSENWASYDWTRNIKELLARKIATGYKGSGSLTSISQVALDSKRDRSVSMPNSGLVPNPNASSPANPSPLGPGNDSKRSLPGGGSEVASGNSSSYSLSGGGSGPGSTSHILPQSNSSNYSLPGTGPRISPQVSNGSYSNNKSNNALPYPIQQNGSATLLAAPNAANYTQRRPSGSTPQQQPVSQTYPQPPQHGSAQYSRNVAMAPPGKGQQHERSASEGTDPNNLMSKVDSSTQPLSPLVSSYQFEPPVAPQHRAPDGEYRSRPSNEYSAQSRANIREEVFGTREPVDDINSIGARAIQQKQAQALGTGIAVAGTAPLIRSVTPDSSSEGPSRGASSPPANRSPRKPVHSPPGERKRPPPINVMNMFDPTANTGSGHYAVSPSSSNFQYYSPYSPPPTDGLAPASSNPQPGFATGGSSRNHSPVPPPGGQQIPYSVPGTFPNHVPIEDDGRRAVSNAKPGTNPQPAYQSMVL